MLHFNIPLWLVLIILSTLSLSIGLIIERIILKEKNSDPVAYSILTETFFVILVLITALVLKQQLVFPHDKYTLFFLTSSILWSASLILSFKAFQKLEASIMSIISALSPIISVPLSIIILHEIFTIKAIIGSILILFAIILVNNSSKKQISKAGLLFAIISSILAGIAVISDAIILSKYNTFSYLVFGPSLTSILLILAYPRKASKAFTIIKTRKFAKIFIFIVLFTIQAVLYYLAYMAGGPMSKLTVINKSYIILTTLLAIIFLKEKSHIKTKILGAILVTIGVLLLA